MDMTPGRERESPQASRAWSDYLAMGEGRSLLGLAARYQSAHAPPTRRLKTLAAWSRRGHWQQRLAVLAEQEAATRERQFVADRAAVFDEGLALEHERVRVLKASLTKTLNAFLQLNLEDDTDGRVARRAEVYGALLRGFADDIAKEVGHRVTKREVNIRHELERMAPELATKYGLTVEEVLKQADEIIRPRG